jgi:hypothetical protein
MHSVDADDGGSPAWQLVLPVGPGAPTSARKLLARCVGPHVGARVLADAELLASELVTNGVLHSGLKSDASLVVRLRLDADALRLEVTNPGVGGSVASHGGAPDRGDGYGLEIVALLSADWGVRRGEDTCVWAEMARA